MERKHQMLTTTKGTLQDRRLRAETTEMLRDMAFVLHLTRRVKEEIMQAKEVEETVLV